MNNKTIREFLLPISHKCDNFFRGPRPLYLGALYFIVLKTTFLLQIPPNDYWWYVQLGQEILQNYSLPATDSYTYTQTGQPIIYNAWLSSVLFWLLRDPTLATLLHGLLPLLFCGLIWQCCRIVGARTKLTMILTLLVVLIGVGHFAMRPQLFSFPLFGLTLLIVLQWQRGKTSYIWLLPVISFLWINLHGAFPLFFLLVGAELVGGNGNRKTLSLVLALSFISSLFNPHGIYAWYFVYTVLLDAPTQQLGPEWLPPTIAQNWQYKLLFLWLLILPIITTFSTYKLKLTDWLWFLGFGWMALSGQRYVIWFVAIFAPLNAMLLSSLANRTIDRRETLGTPGFNVVVFTLFLVLPFSFLPVIQAQWDSTPQSEYTPNTPIAAVKWLKLHPELPGNLWADLAMSVYLIHALPERPVWIDTRTNLFPMQQWNEFIIIVNTVRSWEELLVRDNVKILLLDPEHQPRLVEALTESSKWHSPYKDDHCVIFTLIQQSDNIK